MKSEKNDTNEETEENLTQLHRRVRDAVPGDMGWIWHSGDWQPARLLDGGVINILLDGTVEILSIYRHPGSIADAPWKELIRPPYEPSDETDPPTTHMLTFEHDSKSWSMSWTMDDETGDRISRSISAHIKKILDDPSQCEPDLEGEENTTLVDGGQGND
jgi:hypothetical protein